MKEWDKFLLSVKSTLEEARKPARLALWALLSADLPAIRSISLSHFVLSEGVGWGWREAAEVWEQPKLQLRHIIKSRGLHCVLPIEIPD